MTPKGQVIIHFNILDLDNISSAILLGDDLTPNEIKKISEHLHSKKKIIQQAELIKNLMEEHEKKY
tara:strand:- start:288 stop:485 length:198 start_codon:yes stop_codon:yes gene_type:complete